MGNSAIRAHPAGVLTDLAEKLNIPVARTLVGKGGDALPAFPSPVDRGEQRDYISYGFDPFINYYCDLSG